MSKYITSVSDILTQPLPILLAFEAGPAAGDGVGVMDDPAGEGIARASGVWLKSSRQMGEEELKISCSNKVKNLQKGDHFSPDSVR